MHISKATEIYLETTLINEWISDMVFLFLFVRY